eukprot:GSMAST32.ASY1.ANO1.1775.1 assembled CDS
MLQCHLRKKLVDVIGIHHHRMTPSATAFRRINVSCSTSPVLRSELFIPTVKETPSDATLRSHQLLLRGGYMRRTSSGIYMLLPLGQQVVANLKRLIDEEMSRSTGPELIRFKDRKNGDYCLGPTHEEVFTELVKGTIASYRQLPLCLYQIGQKYRDELRPRFGLLRAREFIMKDAYSFHVDKDDAFIYYQRMDAAYSRIFSRLGAPFVKVEADGGNIGDNMTHEFQILSPSGEDTILRCNCEKCSYASNIEKARGRILETVKNGRNIEGRDIAAHLVVHAKTSDIIGIIFIQASESVNPLLLPPISIQRKDKKSKNNRLSISKDNVQIIQVGSSSFTKNSVVNNSYKKYIDGLGKETLCKNNTNATTTADTINIYIDRTVQDKNFDEMTSYPELQTIYNSSKAKKNNISVDVRLAQKGDVCFIFFFKQKNRIYFSYEILYL